MGLATELTCSFRIDCCVSLAVHGVYLGEGTEATASDSELWWSRGGVGPMLMATGEEFRILSACNQPTVCMLSCSDASNSANFAGL